MYYTHQRPTEGWRGQGKVKALPRMSGYCPTSKSAFQNHSARLKRQGLERMRGVEREGSHAPYRRSNASAWLLTVGVIRYILFHYAFPIFYCIFSKEIWNISNSFLNDLLSGSLTVRDWDHSAWREMHFLSPSLCLLIYNFSLTILFTSFLFVSHSFYLFSLSQLTFSPLADMPLLQFLNNTALSNWSRNERIYL